MAVSHYNTQHTKTGDPDAQRHMGCIRVAQHMATAALPIFPPTIHNWAKNHIALCPENLVPLAARPHSAMVVHQLHHTSPGVPSVCQMGNSVSALWAERCEFYSSLSVLQIAGVLHVSMHLSMWFGFSLFIQMYFLSILHRRHVILSMATTSTVLPFWFTSPQLQTKAIGRGSHPISNLFELAVTLRDVGNLKEIFHF